MTDPSRLPDAGHSSRGSPDMRLPDECLRERMFSIISETLDGGEESEAARQEIAAAVAADPVARRLYVEMMVLDAELEDVHSGSIGDVVDFLAGPHRNPPDRQRHWKWVAALLLLVTLAAAVGGAATWQAMAGTAWNGSLGQISKNRLALPPRTADPKSLMTGRLLGQERLQIASGAVEITMRNGGVLVVEGPADIDLASERSTFLHRGSVVLRRPDVGGTCSVETPAATVEVTRGECGIAVAERLTTDVQVYHGSALVRRGLGRFPRRLDADAAIRCTPGGEADEEQMAFDPGLFLRRLPAHAGAPRAAGAEGDDFYRLFGRPRIAAMDIHRSHTPMVIDGLLDEWASQPAFRASRSADGSGPDWLEGWMRYDAEAIYIAARVGDPHPLRNCVDLGQRFTTMWHGGGLQLFFSLDRSLGWPAEGNAPNYAGGRHVESPLAEEIKATNPRLLTLFLWHHAPSDTDRLAIAAGLGPPAVEAPDRFEGRFVPADDGRGYTLEYRIPWTTLGVQDDPPQPGDRLAACWELHLSDETGRLWRDQIIEVRNLDEPAAICPFERAATWGRADFR